MSMRNKVFIALPTLGTPRHECLHSILRAQTEAVAVDWEVEVRSICATPVTFCQAILLRDFLASDCTHIFRWDDDVSAAPGAFAKMLSHDVDLVAGVYRTKSDDVHFPYRPLIDEAGRPREDRDPETGLMEVEAAPGGFVLMRRAVIEHMVDFYPDLYIVDRNLGKLPHLFEFQVINHEHWSDDFIFHARWRGAGGRVFVDPDLDLQHTGAPRTFAGNFGEYLARRAAARVTQDDLDAARKRLAAAETLVLGGGDLLAEAAE